MPNIKYLSILKKLFLLVIILAIIITGFLAYRLSIEDLFGWRLDFTLKKVEAKDYHSFAPTIAFQYPKVFEIDKDEEKKYGKGYLVGLKLKTDNRTGCDIRTNGPSLDFSKDVTRLSDEVVGPIAERASDFKVIERSKIKLGDQDALKVSFSFLDPIGARVRLDQVFARSDNINFLIICGTGEYQYSLFEKDFRTFYNSINFKGELVTQKTGWKEFAKIFKF